MIDHNKRKLGIGGSEVAALFGADEFKDAFTVWAEKKGNLVRNYQDDRMMVGKELEQGILNIYTRVTKRELDYCDITTQHPDRPFMVYTPDALCRYEKRGVDAKMVSFPQSLHWGPSGCTCDQIPPRVVMQCYWYMAALDFPLWDVVALVDGVPRIYTIERDLEAEPPMLEYAEWWWTKYIKGDERPPLGTSEDTLRWLQQAYPAERKRPDMREATNEEAELLDEYVDLRIEERTMLADKLRLEIAIKAAIAEREGLTWGTNKITWRKAKDGTQTDWKSMALGLRNQFIKDEAERDHWLEMFTHAKSGSRRLLTTHPALAAAGVTEEAQAA
jgi:predicted phage-related endonuclease